MQSHYGYCEEQCRGKDNDCVTICVQKGHPAEPAVKWGLIANCSKDVSYPENVTCDDAT